MLKIAAASALALAAVYLAWPASHAFILAFGPSLLILACPIAMFFMMMSMNGNRNQESTAVTADNVHSASREAKPTST